MMIRRMTEEDIPSVVEMMLSNWDKVLPAYHSPAVVAKFRAEVTPESLSRQMEWKQVYVVEEATQILATGALADFGRPDAPRLCVSQFYVQPHLHGKGIGKRLLSHLIGIARAGGCRRLHVPSSRNAVPFYASSGFSVDAAQPGVADEITWMSADLERMA